MTWWFQRCSLPHRCKYQNLLYSLSLSPAHCDRSCDHSKLWNYGKEKEKVPVKTMTMTDISFLHWPMMSTCLGRRCCWKPMWFLVVGCHWPHRWGADALLCWGLYRQVAQWRQDGSEWSTWLSDCPAPLRWLPHTCKCLHHQAGEEKSKRAVRKHLLLGVQTCCCH